MTLSYKPDGYHTVTPFYQVEDADAFMSFLRDAFDARETQMIRTPEGTVAHAEFVIGDSPIMLTDGGTMPNGVYLYVPDVDSVYSKALQAGAASVSEPEDQFWGDRQAGVRDRWGNMYFIATRKEEVPEDELARRAQEYNSQS